MLRFLEEDPAATAIFIYPTKVCPGNVLLVGRCWLTRAPQALAQDQRLALEQLLYSCPGLEHIKVYNYDGDTPQELRAGQLSALARGKVIDVWIGIRESASVIFTNFVRSTDYNPVRWATDLSDRIGYASRFYTAA